MSPEVEIIEVRAQPIAVIALRARQGELSRVVPAGCGEVWNYFHASGFKGGGRNIAVYLDGKINLEVGAEVTLPFAGNERIRLSSTPAGVAAHAVHLGPYDRLHEAHEAILSWCRTRDRSSAAPSWEVYGHWTDDVTKLRTDVYYLVGGETEAMTVG